MKHLLKYTIVDSETLTVVRSSVLDEALVEAEVVTYAVSPRLLLVVVVAEVLHDILVDVAQQHLALRQAEDCHRDEGDVRVGRLLVARVRLGRLGRYPVGLFIKGEKRLKNKKIGKMLFL